MEKMNVRMVGDGPCGMRLKGGGRQPIVVSKLHKRSRAHASGLKIGDQLLSINGFMCQGMDLNTAIDLLAYSNDLDIELIRNRNYQPREIETDTEVSSRSSRQDSTRRFTTNFRTQISSDADELDRYSTLPTKPTFADDTTRRTATAGSKQNYSSPYGQGQSASNGQFGKGQTTSNGQFGQGLSVSSESWNVNRSSSVGREFSNNWNNWQDSASTSLQDSSSKQGQTWQPSKLEHRSPRVGTQATSSNTTVNVESTGLPRFDRQAYLDRWPHPTAEQAAQRKAEMEMEHRSWRIGTQATSSNTTANAESTGLPRFDRQAYLDRWPHPTAEQAAQRKKDLDDEHAAQRKKDLDDDTNCEVVIWSSKATSEDTVSKPELKPVGPYPISNTLPRVNQDRTTTQGRPTSSDQRQIVSKISSWKPPSVATRDFGMNDFSASSEMKRELPRESIPSWPPQPAFNRETKPVEPIRTWTPVVPLIKERPFVEQLNRSVTPQFPVSYEPAMPVEPVRSWTPQLPVHKETKSFQGDARSDWSTPKPTVVMNGSVSDALFLTRGVISTGAEANSEKDVLASQPKKKLFGDSSFYEDPENKYPTIAEQIKMARKVAQLLTSAINKNAKGQKMFLKRQELSSKWTSDFEPGTYPTTDPRHPTHFQANRSKNTNIMTADELEKMRMFEEKSHHNVVPFDLCSRIANELHEVKGRGGRLFAKRRAKADQCIIENDVVQPIQKQSPHTEFVKKLRAETSTPPIVKKVEPIPTPQPPPPPPPQAVYDGSVDQEGYQAKPTNRLKDMINLPKPAMTPWDSVVQYGHVEKAFEHLRHYDMLVDAENEREMAPAAVVNRAVGGAKRVQNAEERMSYNGKPTVDRPDYLENGNTTGVGMRGGPWSNERPTQIGHRQPFATPPNNVISGNGYRPVQFRIGTNTGLF